MAAAKKALQKHAEENAFFKKVFESQEAFAKAAIPFWAQAQRANANLGAAYAEALKQQQ
jgi:TRAP-type mannitol/chloroaromatic compound transport system substrate-binding protein